MDEEEKDLMNSEFKKAAEKFSRRSVVLVVGGTDPTGGAGLAADIGACRIMQAYPMPVVSCITSQDSKGFRRMQPVDIDIFRDQIESVLGDVVPDAVKVGMLPSARHMRVLAELLCLYEHGPVVFDPIMAPTSGAENFHADWWTDHDTMRLFMSQVTLITPNAEELKRLASPVHEHPKFNMEINPDSIFENATQEDIEMVKMVTDLHLVRTFYNIDRILLTGGHNPGSQRDSDYLLEPRPDIECPPEILEDVEPEADPLAYALGRFMGEHVDTPNTHGTGCVYSTTIACLLAKELPLHFAVNMAKEILGFLLRAGKDWRLYEEGHGPAFSILSMPDSNDRPPFNFKNGLSEFLN